MRTEPIHLTKEQFASMGEGNVGYVRRISSDELLAAYPGIAEIQSGLDIWALFGASGVPILLTEEKDQAVAGAMQNDIQTVPLH